MLPRQFKFAVFPYLMKMVTLLITMTCRVRFHNRAAWDEIQSSGTGYVLGMWHNCSTIGGWAMRDTGITVMVSDSKDGEYVARFGKLFGINAMRGSSSRGAKKAIREALLLLRDNKPIAITPDGPRGPRYKVQSGVLWFAAIGQVPVLPMHIEASRQWVLNSWDGHVFPKPFSTIHIGYGEPALVSRQQMQDDPEGAAELVRTAMMDNVEQVRNAIG